MGIQFSMKKCILHIGMPKTGSSSIQKYLYSKVKSLDGIEYAEIGPINHSGPITYIFNPDIINDPFFSRRGLSSEQIISKKKHFTKKLNNALSAEYETIIISAESLGTVFFKEDWLWELKKKLLKYVDSIEVIAYVRKPISFMESAFQQRSKIEPVDLNYENLYPNYQSRFDKFNNVFEHVTYKLFDKNTLIDGDVVADFCSQLGIEYSNSTVVNKSLNLLSIKFLYQFQRRRKNITINQEGIEILEESLSVLRGAKFKLSKDIVEKILITFNDDITWMENQIGIARCLRNEASDNRHNFMPDMATVTNKEFVELCELAGNQQLNNYVFDETGLGIEELINNSFNKFDKPLDKINIHIGNYTNNVVKGWAFNKAKYLERLHLDIYINNKYVGSCIANQYRQDLYDAGFADGKLGFSLEVNTEIKNGDNITVYSNKKLLCSKKILIHEKSLGFYSNYFTNESSLFIHIPKCAGLAVSSALYGNYGAGHKSIAEYQQSLSHADFSNYFKFSIVRNPWDRFVSAFYFLKKGGMANQHDLLWQEKISSFSSPQELINDELMVDAVKNCIHFKPQKALLMDLRGKLGVDFIGCFESLAEDLTHIGAILGKNVNLESKNSTKHPNYKTLFDENSKNKLAKYYAEDIECFGYNFDNSNLEQMKTKFQSHFLSQMFNKTEGMTPLNKFTYLFEKAKNVPVNDIIIEVGAYRGRSAVALSLGAKSGNKNSIYSVEPHKEFTGIYGGKFGPEDRKVYMQTMLDTLAYQNVNLVNLSSENVNALDCKVGMLWIDGDHSYEGVRRDVDIWQPRLSTNAIVVFDDTGKVDDGPRLVVNELLESELFSVLDDNDSFVSLIKNN